MHWMLLKHAINGDHYMWNGAVAIRVHATDTDEPLLNELTETETDLITIAQFTKAKRTLFIRKQRYSVVAKGVFAEA